MPKVTYLKVIFNKCPHCENEREELEQGTCSKKSKKSAAKNITPLKIIGWSCSCGSKQYTN